MKLIDLDAEQGYLLDGKYKIEPIVRCQDCQYWWKENEVCAEEHHVHEGCCITDVKANDYCSYGERKDG